MPLDTIHIKTENLDAIRPKNLEGRGRTWKITDTPPAPTSQKDFGMAEFPHSTVVHSTHGRVRKVDPMQGCTGAYVEIINGLEATVQFSAKSLGVNYLKGINENTFEECIHNINKVCKDYYELDPYALAESCHVTRAHNTINVDTRPDKIIPIMEALKVAVTWSHKKLDSRYLTSTSFGNKSEVLTFYDKLEELEARSKDMLPVLGGELPPSIRVEHELENLAKVRKVYGKKVQAGLEKNVKLLHALKEKNSLDIIREAIASLKVRDDKEELFSSNEMYELLINKRQRLSTTVRIFGQDTIYQELNGSEAMLYNALKHRIKDKGQLSRTKKQYRESIALVDEFHKIKQANKEGPLKIVKDFRKQIYETLDRLAV